MVSFTTNGQGLYVVNSSEIQKVTVEMLKQNEPDGPVDSTNCQSTFVPLTGPLKPTDTQYHLISKKIVSRDKCDRQSWCKYLYIQICVGYLNMKVIVKQISASFVYSTFYDIVWIVFKYI